MVFRHLLQHTAEAAVEVGSSVAEANASAESEALHLGILLMLFCLALAFLCGYVLHRKHISWIPEAAAALVIGVIVGYLIHVFAGASHMETLLKFDDEFFFVFLLPPIIFEAGYNMKRVHFFMNIGGICMFAFLGTFISTVIIGVLIYMVGAAGWAYQLSFLESLVFGSLISATDPVTVLAVFQAIGADLDLFSMVFGESVMNDAVAIVLYKTLSKFNCHAHPDSCVVTAASVGLGIFDFFKIFVGSFLIGAMFAVLSALMYKHTHLKEKPFFWMEVSLTVIPPYMSWMMAEAFELSGIVAILFCGIIMAHYTLNNLSPEAQDLTKKLFKVLAMLSETFVFIYLGLAMFTYPQDWEHYGLVILSIVIVLISRTFNVFPNAWIVNKFRNPSNKIPLKFQLVMWFSGLRGAIAFALAFAAREDFPGGAGEAMFTCTLFVVIFTVMVMGGGIEALLTKLQVKQKGPERSEMEGRRASKFVQFDRKYLKPLFSVLSARRAPVQEAVGAPGDLEMTAVDAESEDQGLLSSNDAAAQMPSPGPNSTGVKRDQA